MLLALASNLLLPLCCGAQVRWILATPELFGICRGLDRSVAVGESGVVQVCSDMGQWQRLQSWSTNTLRSVAFGHNRFVAVGTGALLTSSNGLDWVQGTNGLDAYSQDVIFNEGCFYALDYLDGILSSSDGFGWARTRVSEPFLSGIAAGNGRIVVTAGRATLVSTDGRDWTSYPRTNTGSLYGLTFGNGRFVAGAFGAYERNQEIISRLAARDPSNARCQFALGNSQERVGDVLLAQGNLCHALKAYERKRECNVSPGSCGR